jgi:hypothetical protein
MNTSLIFFDASVGSERDNLPQNEFARIFECGYRRLFNAAAARNFHSRYGQ